MGRKRRICASVVNEDERWKNAKEWNDKQGRTIQVVGLDSLTGTIFARLPRGQAATIALGEVVDTVMVNLPQHQSLQIGSETTIYEAEQFCRLGAVWVLPLRNKEHPQNRPKWCREYSAQHVVEADSTIRVHSRPARFPSSKKVKIVHENKTLGFTLLNKPGGCPSHATVDNGVENALITIQRNHSYATLPQRLDTETFGLLLVATNPKFASYMSRILEKKTMNCTKEDTTKTIASNKAIFKKYRCLVVVTDGNERYKELQQLQSTGKIVTHYLDSQSPAPKCFRKTISDKAKIRQQKWQLCQLRITTVSRLYSVTQTLAASLWGDRPLETAMYVVQVEVELLTGRTHQIRGQLSAMDVPIVGDPLYGGADPRVLKNSADRDSNRMALQCCAMEFPEPCATSSDAKQKLETTDKRCRFHLDSAWWTEHLQDHKSSITEETVKHTQV